MSKSTLFYGAGVVLSLDYAYIDHEGFVQGCSFNPSFEVTCAGEVNSEILKQQIKEVLKYHDTGIDHKLVVYHDSAIESIISLDRTITIKNHKISLTVPKDAVHITSGNTIVEAIQNAIDNAQLLGKYTIKVDGDTNPILPNANAEWGFRQFSYVHGVKNSDSFGEQNLLHGHLGYVQVVPMESSEWSAALDLQDALAEEFDGVMFIWKDNYFLTKDTNAKWQSSSDIATTGAKYETVRGKFRFESKTPGHNNFRIAEKETTIENLVEMIFDRTTWYGKIKDRSDKITSGYKLYVGEGLNSGAMCVHKTNDQSELLDVNYFLTSVWASPFLDAMNHTASSWPK